MQTSKQQPGFIEDKRGAVALITVAVFTAILIVIGVTVSGIGNNEIVLSGVFSDGENAFSIADACAEESLTRLKLNSGFTGTTFFLDGGTCSSVVSNVSGNDYLIVAQGSYNENTRIVEANVTIGSNGQGNAHSVTITSWKEAN
jgi:hypothetical protein